LTWTLSRPRKAVTRMIAPMAPIFFRLPDGFV